MVVKEAGPSCCLDYVGHKNQVESTNGTLGVSQLPTDLVELPCLFTISEDLRCMSSYAKFPHRRELAPWQYLTSLILFIKVGQLNLLC